MTIEEIMLAYNVSKATAYRYLENGIPSCKLKKFAKKDSFSNSANNEKMRIIFEKNENFENFENEKNENPKNENEKILNAILRIEKRLNSIEAQQNLIVARFEKIEKMRIQSENFETNNEKNEKKEGGLGGVSLSSLESNSLIDIEDSIKENIKRKNENEKIEKIKKVRKSVVKSESEKQEIEEAFQIFKNSYPENTHELEEEKCRKHWQKLSNEEIQKALDSIPMIQERFKCTEPQFIVKLSNYILKKLWNELDPRKIELLNQNNKINNNSNIAEELLRRARRKLGEL
jgi:hypothetical protein